MFTGLVEDIGVLISRQVTGTAGKLEVETHLPLDTIQVGDSLSVNGACLTVEVARAATRTVVFHTLAETLKRTNLGSLAVGGLVNLERALRVGDRMGGHFVQGHVDCVAPVQSIQERGDDIILTIALPDDLQALLIPKGSIAVNGISLTVAQLEKSTFSVHVIPHSWRATNLATLGSGDGVNLEADMLGKYLLRFADVSAGESSVTIEALRAAGFED